MDDSDLKQPIVDNTHYGDQNTIIGYSMDDPTYSFIRLHMRNNQRNQINQNSQEINILRGQVIFCVAMLPLILYDLIKKRPN